MKKMKYVAPQTKSSEVELESNFCGSADIRNPNNAGTGQIEEQQVNTDFGFNFADQEWDKQ